MNDSQNQFADIIPEPEAIRERINRAEREANLLRRLLRLSLRRDREVQELADDQHKQGVSS